MNKIAYPEKVILQVLEEHQGSDSPITCQQLEKITGFSSRKIRKIIANLVIKHHIPIASSVHYPYGFYLITDKQEAEICLKQYYSRAKEVVNRARILSEAVKEKFGISYQEEFDFARERKPST
jgi:hypothetical protein